MRRFPTPVAPGWVSLAALLVAALPDHALAQDGQVSISGATEVTSPAPAGAAVETTAPSAPAVEAQATSAPAPAAEPTEAVAAADEAPRDFRPDALRTGTTYFGPAGGIYVVDAGSGAPKSFRIQLMTDLFVKKDYLYAGDKNRYTGGVLALSATPVDFLELSAAVTTRSNRNTKTDPEVLQAIGDLYFDVKGFYEVIPGLTFGADGSVNFLNGPGQVGVDFAGTSFGARANFAADLRKLVNVPLQLRLNVGHIFDNSTEMVEDLENARYENLVASGVSGANGKGDEFRHLVRRDERLALGINRVDRTVIAVGAEVPIAVNDRFAIHPIVEWDLAVPVNRRGFDCPYVTDAQGDKLAGTDSCLADEGVDTWPQRITAGVRVYPWLKGLSVLAGAEVGLGGTTNFVQELAPTAPYKILLALGYTADLAPPPPAVREVEKVVEVAVAPHEGRVLGTIVEQGQPGVVVADARIGFPGTTLNPLLGTADGRFATYPFVPGAVAMAIEAEGYQAGDCAATIPEAGGDVNVTCELVALPRVGSIAGQVVGADGAPIANAKVELTGPETRTLTTDAAGKLREENLPPGDYRARIEQEGFLISVTPVTVKVRSETPATIQLVPVPKNAQVTIKKDRLQIKGSIFFTTDTADIEGRSEPLLTEIADVLIRNPDIQRVEVQGHTDDTGTAEHNLELSERRAQAVKAWLAFAGVERDRLVAKGYGSEKPIVPNVTPQGRSRNRRVEFVILERAKAVPSAKP